MRFLFMFFVGESSKLVEIGALKVAARERRLRVVSISYAVFLARVS